MKVDKRQIFRYATLRSAYVMEKLRAQEPVPDSVVYFNGIEFHTKSSAVIRILYDLGGFWKCVSVFKVIPIRMLDWLYDLVARNRYRWFGRQVECTIPDEKMAKRLIG